jgi:heat shock protein HslJ
MAYIARMVLRPTRAFGSALTAAVLSFALGACGDSGEASSTPAIELTGEFLSVEQSTFELVPNTTVRMSFEENRISLSAGCNTMFGQYQLDDSQLRVGPLASTMIGCPEALATQDQRLDEFLTGGPLLSASTDGFTLTGSDGATLVMVTRAVADPDRPLTGSQWRVESIIQDEAFVAAVGFESVAVSFTGDQVQVNTPCATGSASYTMLEDGNLTTGDLNLTDVVAPDPTVCSPDYGVHEAQQALSQVFGGTVQVDGNASRVTLTGNGIGITMRTD